MNTLRYLLCITSCTALSGCAAAVVGASVITSGLNANNSQTVVELTGEQIYEMADWENSYKKKSSTSAFGTIQQWQCARDNQDVSLCIHENDTSFEASDKFSCEPYGEELFCRRS